MKLRGFIKILFLCSSLIWAACRQESNDSKMIIVDQNSKITLFGKATSLEDLQPKLFDSLIKMSIVPNQIDIKYDDEVLMGTRSEVETEAGEAIKSAKASKSKPIVEIQAFRKEKGTDCDSPDEDRTNCAIINFEYPVVTSGTNPLKTSVKNWVTSYLTSILTVEPTEENTPIPTLNEASEAFFKTHEEFEGSVMYGAFTAESGTDVLLNDKKHLTLAINGYSFQGGAHGSPSAAMATFESINGKRLRWEDFITDKTALKLIAEKKFRQERAEVFNDGFDFDEIFPFKLPDNYGLTKTGIYFNYAPYEVAPYAMGGTTFLLSFSEISDLLNIKK